MQSSNQEIFRLYNVSIKAQLEMQPIEEQLKQAQADFKRLQKDKQLPPLMQIKLAFLKALITKAPEAHDIGQRLEPLESQSIIEMPRQTQQKLFIQIVRCLSGRDTVTFCKGQRAYIRRQGKIFSWQKLYLNCDTNSLTFRRKRQSQEYQLKFQLQKLNLSNSFKHYKGKHVIAIDYEDLKYVIGFDQEITCERIHKIIGNLIEQKRQWVETKFDNLQFMQQRQAQRLALPAHRIKRIMDHEEYQHLLTLQQRIRSFELEQDEGFRLHRAFQQGRVLVGKNGIVKSQMLVKGYSPTQVASCYVQMASWNPSVELLQISSRPRHNCLLARLVTNKYSIFSFKREANLAIHYFKPCNCQHNHSPNQSFLLIEDLPTEEKTQTGGTRMNFKQILRFIPNKEDQKSLLVVSLTQAKFNGLCSEADNLAMTLHLVENIQKFIAFLNEKGSSFSGYFQPMACPCGGKQSLDLSSCLSLPTEKQEIDGGLNQKISLKALKLNYQFNQKRVIATMEDICSGLLNEEFLQLLKHRAHYCYFLKHKFTDNEESICTYKDDNRNFLKEGIKWELNCNDLKFIDTEVLAAQKDILKMILKQLSSNIMSGKSIMNMSLPVQIFDRRSMLDAIADSYGFLGAFAPKIVEATDLVQQMKYMICAFMFLHATCPSVEKPFNPILGQTYQGKIGELPVYLQQISHHPPISSILIKTKGLQVFGNVEVVVDMGLNSVYSYLCHWLKAKVLSTNTQYLIKLPDVQMEGIMYGDRIYKVVNKGFILEVSQNLFAEFSVGKHKKRVYESTVKLNSSDVVGGIFKVKQEFADKVKNCSKPKSFEGLKPEHVVETCCFLSGKWYGDIYFDKVCYKSKKEGPFPFKAQRMKYVLPSDSIWREDLLFKIWKDNERSNREKQQLQNLQRNDRKLREKFKKSR